MGKKLTYEEVYSAFQNKGYELISTEYIGINKKLQYICPKHKDKGVQEIDYAHFKRRQGCKYCGRENQKHGREKDLKEYNAKELTESKGMEFVKITRENSKLCIYYICSKHRDKGVQKTSLESIRRMSVGCQYCIGRGKTTEEFKKELYSINPNIKVLGEYVKATDGILCECLIDGTRWSPQPHSLLQGQGCPECGRIASNKNSTKTNKQFLEELKEVTTTITPLEPYYQAREKIRVKCDVCGYEWPVTPDRLLQGSGCSECAKRKAHDSQAKSNEQFLDELNKCNPDLLPLEPYYNDHTKILVKCLIHDYVWPVAPNKILRRRTGCPKCCRSHNEAVLDDFIQSLGYTTTLQKTYSDCKDKYVLPFDIYINELNILVEYDGEQHYRSVSRGIMAEAKAEKQFKTTQLHDAIKTQYCADNNIHLIRVPYWEKKNITTYFQNELNKIIKISE